MSLDQVSGPSADPLGASGPVLSVRGVEGGYGDQQILRGVTLHVAPRELVVIVGPNGAGKSTLTKTIVGLLQCWSGAVDFDGTSCQGRRPDQLARAGLAYVPQLNNVFRDLTVQENMQLAGHLSKRRRSQNIDRVLEMFPTLLRHKATKAGALSGGERQMVAMARAMLLEPRLIVLDEPTAGLSPRTAETVFDKLVELREDGLGLLVVEQNVEEALSRCDRAYVLANGATCFEGEGPALLGDSKLRALYLTG